MVRRILREPLVHFLALGAGLFLFFRLTGGDPRESNRIVISRGQIEHLSAAFARTWSRPPTDEELKHLVDDSVREEIAEREARAMGLDREDTVVRRRLRQKFEFVAEEIADSDKPTDAQLEAWMKAHPDSFRMEPRVAFRQVYLDRARRGKGTPADAAKLLARLRAAGPEADIRDLGDGVMLAAEVPLSTAFDIAKTFGGDFTAALLKVEPGRWTGPVESGFGTHLVFVSERVEGRALPLSEIRESVERDFLAQRRKERLEALYEGLLKKYRVEVAKPEAGAGRAAAARTSPSAVSR